jgi:hypothetical protein
MEIAESAPTPSAVTLKEEATPPPSETKTPKAASSLPAIEDLSTVPYISQNYRFTDDELRWLRRSAFDFSERNGVKISQNTILRVALRELRNACERSASSNPLTRAIARLKK